MDRPPPLPLRRRHNLLLAAHRRPEYTSRIQVRYYIHESVKCFPLRLRLQRERRCYPVTSGGWSTPQTSPDIFQFDHVVVLGRPIYGQGENGAFKPLVPTAFRRCAGAHAFIQFLHIAYKCKTEVSNVFFFGLKMAVSTVSEALGLKIFKQCCRKVLIAGIPARGELQRHYGLRSWAAGRTSILARGELQRHYGITGLRSGIPGRTGIPARGELQRHYGLRDYEVGFLAGLAFLPVANCCGITALRDYEVGFLEELAFLAMVNGITVFR